MAVVPVIDLFAGPGGLGEGFSQVGWKEGHSFFKIGLSVEKDESAHRTLRLRSFLRQFQYDKLPPEYFNYLNTGLNPENAYSLSKYRRQSEAARKEAWHEELRKDASFNKKLDRKIRSVIRNRDAWVLIGGPPCQAYSLAGRSRNKGKKDYVPEEDNRHFLYEEYLRIISVHSPAVFVMENVKGLLSAKLNGENVFTRIRNDLARPGNGSGAAYRIYSLVSNPKGYSHDGTPLFRDSDFVIKAENYGIPQTRHRVILLGVREDFWPQGEPGIISPAEQSSIRSILNMPKLRSGLSRSRQDSRAWYDAVVSFPRDKLSAVQEYAGANVVERILEVLNCFSTDLTQGGEFVSSQLISSDKKDLLQWLCDPRLDGAINHFARNHMKEDLHRYLFAACFAEVLQKSPKLSEFPNFLKPAHKNCNSGAFADRFRVQLYDRPAKTITCHISKDGHYYIHPDPTQCRSLTVREAARIQTFPDNYFFCGHRTNQFVQVGNAVPPLLAHKIANVVKEFLTRKQSDD